MNDVADKISLDAIKESLAVIENNSLELPQIKESLLKIEQLLGDLVESVNEAVGAFEASQEIDQTDSPKAESSREERPTQLPMIIVLVIVALMMFIFHEALTFQSNRASARLSAQATAPAQTSSSITGKPPKSG